MTNFVKMHGQGNDFIIVDADKGGAPYCSERVALLSHRNLGIGCDQFVVLHPSHQADIRMQIFNADGGEVSACGNATRCVAYLLHKRTAKKHLMIETKAGLVSADVEGGLVSIVLPAPATNPERVPLTRALRSQDFSIASLHDPQGVNVGNPHIVFFPDWDSPLPALTDFGAALNHKHPLIPEGANIEWVKIVSPQHLQLQVYERGVGVTMSCGTGACAAVVAAHEQGLSAKSCRVSLQGGDLTIEILPDKRLVLRGPVCYVCEGVLSI